MAAPTAPYCTSADVAGWLTALSPIGDFTVNTVPTKNAIDALITKYSAWIEGRFAAEGYYIPWQELPDETWPAHQTSLLLLVCSLGVAGAISGPVMKPAPAIGSQRSQTDNQFTKDFKEFLTQIKEDGIGFRALYRVGSRAEQFVREPSGPITDYLLGYIDPTRYQTIGEYTALFEKVREDYQIASGVRPWDHLATKRQELIGI